MHLSSFPVIERPVAEIQLTTHMAPPAWRASLELTRPLNWLLPMAAAVAGIIASGQPISPWMLAAALLLVGPLLTGTSHVINAYFDRRNRPLSGAEDAAVAQIGILSMITLVLAHALGGIIFSLSALTLAIAFAVNAPPLNLRRQTWWNGLFHGLVDVAVPWCIGHMLFGPMTTTSALVAGLFSFGAIGARILSHLPEAEGDRLAGIRSLAALLGPEVGAGIAALMIDTTLLGAAIVCEAAMLPLLGVLALQVALQLYCYPRPHTHRWATPLGLILYLAAMLIAAGSASSSHLF